MDYEVGFSSIDSVSRLNSKNVGHLWALSSIFSALDYLPGRIASIGEPPLFPTLHPMRIVMFDWAILHSKASSYKDRRLTGNDLIFVWNGLNDYVNNLEALTEQGDEPAFMRVFRLFSTMANKQFRLQARDLKLRMARSYLLNEKLPIDFASELQRRAGPKYIDIPSAVVTEAGLTPREVLNVGFVVIALYKQRLEPLLARIQRMLPSKTRMQNTVRVHARIIEDIVRNAAMYEGNSVFIPKALVNSILVGCTEEKLVHFFAHVSAVTPDLRRLLPRQPYTHGFISDRLSPLERFPVVRLGKSASVNLATPLVVPSLHYFDRLVTDLPHFVLQDDAKNREAYHVTRGLVQEVYLRELTANRLPNATLIPEVPYRLSRGEWSGPDLTILDTESAQMVVVESKARRARGISIAELDTEPLASDLRGAVDALLRLEQKLDHLIAGLPEYEEHQSTINRCRINRPICVVVVGDGVEFLAEKVEVMSRDGLVPSLDDFPYKYCFMNVESYEHALELVASGSATLTELLNEYGDVAKSVLDERGLAGPTADQYGGREIGDAPVFVSQFVDDVISPMV